MADRAHRRRFHRSVRKEADRLLIKIEAVRTRAKLNGWDDVVVELDQAEALVWAGDGKQSRKHVEQAAVLFRRHAAATAN